MIGFKKGLVLMSVQKKGFYHKFIPSGGQFPPAPLSPTSMFNVTIQYFQFVEWNRRLKISFQTNSHYYAEVCIFFLIFYITKDEHKDQHKTIFAHKYIVYASL